MTRYDLNTNYHCGEAIEEMEKATDGEWVRYEDVEPLIALLREAKREHFVNEEECYYSCASLQPTESRLFGPCTCGADDWNARIDEVLK